MKLFSSATLSSSAALFSRALSGLVLLCSAATSQRGKRKACCEICLDPLRAGPHDPAREASTWTHNAPIVPRLLAHTHAHTLRDTRALSLRFFHVVTLQQPGGKGPTALLAEFAVFSPQQSGQKFHVAAWNSTCAHQDSPPLSSPQCVIAKKYPLSATYVFPFMYADPPQIPSYPKPFVILSREIKNK